MNGKHQLTQAGLEEYKKELDHLKNVDRVRNIESLKDARAQGDLSENADDDAARDEQAKIENRIKVIENIINNHILINGKSKDNIGKTLELEFVNNGMVQSFSLVGSLEADPEQKKISNESPLGYAILKAKVGDRVLVKTEVSEFYVIVKGIK